jgi:hypothetical protein
MRKNIITNSIITFLVISVSLTAQEKKKYNLKISAGAQKASVLYKACSSGTGSSYGSNRQDEHGAVTQAGDKHEQYLFNTVKKYNRTGKNRNTGDLTLSDLIKKLDEYISYYQGDAAVYKVVLVRALYIIETGGETKGLPAGRVDDIKKAVKTTPGLAWPFFYRAIHSFLSGWISYISSDYTVAYAEFRSFAGTYEKLDKDKKKFMESYKAFSLYAMGDCKLQLGKIKENEMPAEWTELKSIFPGSDFSKLVDSYIEK